jgi:ATP-binding cassette, subfamily C, bacterial CydCD
MGPVDLAPLRRLPGTRGPVRLLAGVGVVSGVVALAQAVVLAWTVTVVAGGGDLGPPLTWLVMLVVLRGLLAGASEVVARRAGHAVAAAVRLQVLGRWLSLPEGRRPAPDEAVTLAGSGVTAVEPYVARYLPSLVTAGVVPALAVALLAVVDPWSALIVVLTLPLLPLFAALIGMHTRVETERRWAAMAQLAGHFLDVVRGLPTLVSYGRAEAQVDTVRAVGARHRDATVRTLRTAFMSTAALELLATISVALVAVAVGLRLAYGAMDLQVGLTAILLAPEAYWPVRRVGQEFHNAADGTTALDELSDHLTPPEPRTPAPAGAPVRVSGVTYAHPGRPDTLSDLTVATPPGPGLTTLTGPSGAGKTTLLELVAGLRVPQTGSVTAPASHLATQRPLVLPGTVLDNLRLADAGAEEPSCRAALEQVGLWDDLAAREGLATRLGDDGFGLSAGQRTRLALARALLARQPLVLLDEPTAHVATADVPRLHDVIAQLATRCRVVAATHDPDLVDRADTRWTLRRPPEAAQPAVAVTADPQPAVAVPDEVPVPASRWQRIAARHRLAAACVLGGLSVASGVALTATSGWLIVQASFQPVVLTLLVAIVGVRAFGLARPLLRYAERVVSHDVALAELAERRTDVYARLIPLTPARLGRRHRGDVLTAVVRDLDDVVDEKVRVTVPWWSTVIASLAAVAILTGVLPAAGLAMAVGAVAALAVGRLGRGLELAAQASAVEARGTVLRETTSVASRLTQVQAVTGREAAARVLTPIRRAQDTMGAAETRLIQGRAVTLALEWLVVAATTAVVARLAWEAFGAGALEAPLAALVTLTPMALADAFAGLAEVGGSRARSQAAAARVARVLDQAPAVAGRGRLPMDGPGTPVALDEVTASWTGTGTDLGPFTLAPLHRGERVQLTGPNGAGKSTALAVLARHLDPLSGRHTMEGVDVLDLDLVAARAAVAVVDDEPHAFAGSIRANLALAAPHADDDSMTAALRVTDLGRWLARQPAGLDTPLTGLSGGERTRLAMARAVLSGRPVLLLDEPTAHLDDVTAERAMVGLIAADDHDGARRAVVVVSHRPLKIRCLDRREVGISRSTDPQETVKGR